MTYAYKCSSESCAHEFEVTKSMACYDREEGCPKCGAPKAGRVYTPTAVHFGSVGYNASYGGKNASSKPVKK